MQTDGQKLEKIAKRRKLLTDEADEDSQECCKGIILWNNLQEIIKGADSQRALKLPLETELLITALR